MPAGAFFGTLFFMLLVFAAWTSAISLVEPLVTWLVENKGMNRVKAAAWAGLVAWSLGCVSLLSLNVWSEYKLFGKSFIDLMDYATANVMLPLGGLLIAIFTGWLMSRASSMDELGSGDSLRYRLWRALVGEAGGDHRAAILHRFAEAVAAGASGRAGPDVSREGVQRDLLPIVEGSTVQTRYGMVGTEHILSRDPEQPPYRLGKRRGDLGSLPPQHRLARLSGTGEQYQAGDKPPACLRIRLSPGVLLRPTPPQAACQQQTCGCQDANHGAGALGRGAELEVFTAQVFGEGS